MKMIFHIALIVSLIKLFFLPLYRSTDFEVHRNWLAITHNVSIEKWYYESTSQWTLDYPPFFAWLEFGLSQIAKFFDPEMLQVQNLNYDSQMTVVFQRLSVIVLDIVYIYGVKSCSTLVSNGKILVFILMVSNPGLLMVDHIHFQYNGFLYGILLFSMSYMIKVIVLIIFHLVWKLAKGHMGHLMLVVTVVANQTLNLILMKIFASNKISPVTIPPQSKHKTRRTCSKSEYVQASIWFAVLLNFKHIFLYIAPVYVVFLLRSYCFTLSTTDGVHTPWHSFSITNLCILGTTVTIIFLISFGPFLDHLPQIFSRLFPFQRGLCHAYWAPNIWALYNIADKVLQYTLPLIGYSVPRSEASMTGGLVQEYKHSVLPSITPKVTFTLTVLSMLPALIKLWHLGADRRYRNLSFIRCMIVCATCSFLFGWHVHEKAILMVIIPLSFMSVLGDVDGKQFLIMSTVGHYSLFPLLYPKNLLFIKIFMLLTHSAIAFSNIPSFYELPRIKGSKKQQPRAALVLPGLNRVESSYLYGLMVISFFEYLFVPYLGIDKTLPFLPLMITSVYCSIGIIYSWICYYYYFLTFNVSRVPIMVSGQSSLFAKKVT